MKKLICAVLILCSLLALAGTAMATDEGQDFWIPYDTFSDHAFFDSKLVMDPNAERRGFPLR